MNDALSREIDEFIRDSIIQRFEFTFELLWKTIKRVGEFELLECQSPKTCFSLAFRLGVIVEEAVFLDMLACRNLTSHTYEEENADTVVRFVRDQGTTALSDVIHRLGERIQMLKS